MVIKFFRLKKEKETYMTHIYGLHRNWNSSGPNSSSTNENAETETKWAKKFHIKREQKLICDYFAA